MTTKQLTPRKALNKAYLKVKPSRSEMEVFKANLIQLLDRTNDTESEEFHKNLVIDFLKKTYYEPNYFLNTKERKDLVIHNGSKSSDSVGVIVEAKKPTNKSEMVSEKKLNTKAFQELVLYYLRERVTHKNLEVKHLVITNINEWYVFDAMVFDRLFAQNKNFVKQFTDFEAGRLADTKTDFFYKQIAEPYIAQLTTEIEFTYFNIQDYQKPLRNEDKADDTKLIALFKLLSPEHLLKLPFTNDSNSLDKRFYSELLHIIGLTETKQGGKKLIERHAKGERHSGSILEDAIIQLDSMDKISRLDQPSQYGSSHEERLFNVGLQLSITWINRVLFLKLLEAQLITYHKGDTSYAFLSLDKIKNYDDLNSLFFQVLAKRYEDRNPDVAKLFEKVPYLNSSLFEPTDMEHNTLFISNLKDEKTIPILSSTVLKNEQGKKRTGELSTLEYLFEFLNAYDFSSEGSEDIQEDNKTLINASVLGLIFEKINGYKDGSFFTPGFITMYMCRETIRKAVVQKFNEAIMGQTERDPIPPLEGDKGGGKYQDLTDIYNAIGSRGDFSHQEANTLINNIKICDPAVGSGHFLVSALNEMIAVKHDLGVLHDRHGKLLRDYDISVVNDELIVTDVNGELFQYTPTNKESQRIQETLFHEKQTIIENCLFGVDINPNSVKICRLRLWIELLKNAYYESEVSPFGGGERGRIPSLQTLPNIDINIKCGNSLISRFDMDADIKQALKKSKWSIDSYRVAVGAYRNAQSKEEKREMERLIADIKSDFRSEISQNDPKVKKLQKLGGELFLLTNQQQLFEMSKREKAAWNKKVATLTKESKKLEAEIEEIKSNKIYENAFEWRFEFPEVLDKDGNFVGFDVVIGNPPYIRRTDLDLSQKLFFEHNYRAATKQYDLYLLFIEKGLKINKQKGFLTYINPMFFVNESGIGLRELILNNYDLLRVVNLSSHNIFEEASTYPCIIEIQNSHNSQDIIEYVSDSDVIISNYLSFLNSEFYSRKDFVKNENFSFDFSSDKTSRNIAKNIDAKSKPLGEYFFCARGVPNNKITFDLNGVHKGLKSKNVKRYHIVQDFENITAPLNVIEIFDDEMILLPRTVLSLTGAYVRKENELVILDRIYYLKKKGDDICLMTILGIINSKLINYWFEFNFSSTKVRGGYFDLRGSQIVKIPIISINEKPIRNLVTSILDKKSNNLSADTTALESQIDQLVYELYGLTEEEIAIVENSVN